jgi:hypothetical protein
MSADCGKDGASTDGRSVGNGTITLFEMKGQFVRSTDPPWIDDEPVTKAL